MIPSLLAVAAATLSGVGSAHPYLGPGRPVPRRDDWLPEPKDGEDDEPVPLAPAYGYGLASLNGGRTLEEMRAEREWWRRRDDRRRQDKAQAIRSARCGRNLWLVQRGGLVAASS